MKAFIIWLMISLAFVIACIYGIAHANESPTQIIDCDFKPRQSDEVIVYCGTLNGKGSVSVRLCGINYTIDVICK